MKRTYRVTEAGPVRVPSISEENAALYSIIGTIAGVCWLFVLLIIASDMGA